MLNKSSDDGERTARVSTTTIVIAGFCFGLLYVLSPAPVSWIMLRFGTTPMFDKGFELAYAPLIWCYESIPAAERFYDWYFSLWGLQ